MRLTVVGMNHRTAPIQVRERLAVPPERLQATMSALHGRYSPHLAELAILATCNRFEVYVAASSPDVGRQTFNHVTREIAGFSLQDVQEHTYAHVDAEAVRHLCRVAAGLDSMVLGESQILGQVVDAYRLGQAAGTVGPLLSRLFQQAIHTGKRVRRETAIGQAPTSVSSAAVRLLQQEVPDLAQRRVLIVGAGTMAQIAGRNLRQAGVTKLAIVNRTAERAARLASELGAHTYPWDALPWALTWAEVAVVATAAPNPIVERKLLLQVQAHREGHPLVIVDIGVPRNVDPRAANLPEVRVFHIDDLRRIAAAGIAQRRQAVPHAEAIVEEGVVAFTRWWRSRVVAPTIAALHAQAESIRQQVVKRTLRRLPPDAPREEVADVVSRYLLEKLLQVPARNLRALALEEDPTPYQEALERLFDLVPESSSAQSAETGECKQGGQQVWEAHVPVPAQR